MHLPGTRYGDFVASANQDPRSDGIDDVGLVLQPVVDQHFVEAEQALVRRRTSMAGASVLVIFGHHNKGLRRRYRR